MYSVLLILLSLRTIFFYFFYSGFNGLRPPDQCRFVTSLFSCLFRISSCGWFPVSVGIAISLTQYEISVTAREITGYQMEVHGLKIVLNESQQAVRERDVRKGDTAVIGMTFASVT